MTRARDKKYDGRRFMEEWARDWKRGWDSYGKLVILRKGKKHKVISDEGNNS